MPTPIGAARAGGRRMVISQPAFICLEAMAEHVRRVVAALFGGRDGQSVGLVAAAVVPVMAAEPSRDLDRDGGEAGERGATDGTLLSAPERRARAAALRGLLLARQRRFAGAQAAFAEAVRLDPAFDPTAMPTFWELERAGHEALVGAFLAADRPRDAEALAARLRGTYRPRLVRTRSDKVREPAVG